jgi:hypothetical protein
MLRFFKAATMSFLTPAVFGDFGILSYIKSIIDTTAEVFCKVPINVFANLSGGLIRL